MATMENKVEVITEFLENRAQLARVTNLQEIQRVAGEKLLEKGYRSFYPGPVERNDVIDALATIATNTYAADKILLPALVTHFWDNEPISYFSVWASNAGLMLGFLEEHEGGETREQINALHPVELAKVFAHYGHPVEVPSS